MICGSGEELMNRRLRMVFLGFTACAVFWAMNDFAIAGTIIKLSLGAVSPDIEFDGTTLSTPDDGNVDAPGDQDTAVEFLDVLESVAPDIITAEASFTMNGLTPSGQAFVLFGSSVLQEFTGGTFSLYDVDDSTILLSGDLADSALTGPIGFSGGGLFTTSFGTFTDGTLKDYLAPDTLVLSMHVTAVQTVGGGVGFSANSVTGSPPIQVGNLNPFTGDAAISIEGVPEPAAAALMLAGGMLLAVSSQRRRCF